VQPARANGPRRPACRRVQCKPFTDPDDYTAAIRGASAELTVIGRGRFSAKLTRIDLHRLWMHRFSDNLPRIAHSANVSGRTFVSFRTQPGPSLLSAGLEMRPTDIMRHYEGQSSFQHSSGSASFGYMSLPIEEMASVGAEIAGCDLTPPRDMLIVTPPPAAMAKLQRLHAAAGRLAEEAPSVIAHPEAAHGLEQALIEALVGCLSQGEVLDRPALRHHAMIMRRFRRAVEENPDQALYIPELCSSIGVAGRTLRTCCQEQLGMSPKRYLLLRRMHLARRALRESRRTTTTVTEIATRYGFWEFGRFAGAYRSLFGELPSTTLGHPRV
jgi:AraC-like DNA-binding protein